MHLADVVVARADGGGAPAGGGCGVAVEVGAVLVGHVAAAQGLWERRERERERTLRACKPYRPQVLCSRVQQTPNPSAQDPALVPPLALHSASV